MMETEINKLLEQFGESVGEKRKTILGIKLVGGYSTSMELEPCSLTHVLSLIGVIEQDGLIIAGESHQPSAGPPSLRKDTAFRHPPHTIVYIEIIRRREWNEESDEDESEGDK